MLTAVAAFVVYMAVQSHLEKAIYEHLMTAARSRASHIETFLEEHRQAVALLGAEAIFKELLRTDKGSLEYSKIWDRVNKKTTNVAKIYREIYEVIVLDIYGSAREEHGGVSSEDLVDKISKNLEVRSKKVLYIPTLQDCEKYLRENVQKGDVVLLMGAGDVFRIGENLVKE